MADIAQKKSLLLSKLEKSFTPGSILSEAEDCLTYSSDWTRLTGNAMLVILPSTTQQVSLLLKTCHELEIPVIPSGGRTGLAGGAVASSGEVVLNLSRMNRIDSIDLLGNTLRVQAGAITEAVHEHCANHDLTWPIDLASKGTCQIGGNLSTNAGGVRVIRYGMTRKWVSGLQIVTMDGNIIELNNGLEKNNTGYDLIQLMIGAEGTLAVITEATLKLTKLPKNKIVFFFALEDLDSVSQLFKQARSGPFEILAFEFFSEKCRLAVETKLKRKSKLQNNSRFNVLMEIELGVGKEAEEKVDNWLTELFTLKIVTDGMMAKTPTEQSEVWGLREGITESIALTNSVRKYDVAVAVKDNVPFLTEALELFTSMKLNADLYLFGHFGDGSPHLNLVKHVGVADAEFLNEVLSFEKTLYPLIKKYGGSASAEHGVGLLKKSWVAYSRSRVELELFRAIKNIFDPKNLLNPGKLIPSGN